MPLFRRRLEKLGLEGEHAVVLDANIIPLDRDEAMQVWGIRQLLLYFGRREAFVCHNDATLNLAVANEGGK